MMEKLDWISTDSLKSIKNRGQKIKKSTNSMKKYQINVERFGKIDVMKLYFHKNGKYLNYQYYYYIREKKHFKNRL
jgi:hypothetical protein